MFSYTVSKEASTKEFENACSHIEKVFEDLEKDKGLVDVDGSQIQIYMAKGNKIKVVNDYEIDAVYVDSEIEIPEILN